MTTKLLIVYTRLEYTVEHEDRDDTGVWSPQPEDQAAELVVLADRHSQTEQINPTVTTLKQLYVLNRRCAGIKGILRKQSNN